MAALDAGLRRIERWLTAGASSAGPMGEPAARPDLLHAKGTLTISRRWRYVVVHCTIIFPEPDRNLSHGRSPPQFFRFRCHQDDGRFPLPPVRCRGADGLPAPQHRGAEPGKPARRRRCPGVARRQIEIARRLSRMCRRCCATSPSRPRPRTASPRTPNMPSRCSKRASTMVARSRAGDQGRHRGGRRAAQARKRGARRDAATWQSSKRALTAVALRPCAEPDAPFIAEVDPGAQAALRRGLEPDVAAVAARHVAGDRQAETDASGRRVARGIEPYERPKNAVPSRALSLGRRHLPGYRRRRRPEPVSQT